MGNQISFPSALGFFYNFLRALQVAANRRWFVTYLFAGQYPTQSAPGVYCRSPGLPMCHFEKLCQSEISPGAKPIGELAATPGKEQIIFNVTLRGHATMCSQFILSTNLGN